MSTNQKQDKLDKRAAALRDNLKKRKALGKAKKDSAKKQQQDSKDGSG